MKVNLLVQLSSELRSPLTSVMGMARMLEQQLYGPLTDKQKEYIGIIHNSGQQLLLVVEEMLTLGVLDQHNAQLNLSSADVEMLCQQSLSNLESLAQQHQQNLRLSIEPGNRIWLLDKEKIRQALYYLVYSLVQSAQVGSEIQVHVSRKVEDPINPMPILTISVWATHPWLDNNLPRTGLETARLDNLETAEETAFPENPTLQSLIKSLKVEQRSQNSSEDNSREVLGLLLSCHLIEMHGGKIIIQGSPDIGYRYVFKIPQIEKQLDN
ncbi:MAG: HAMP domain-containing histidine kinase [Kamptonema sp. SIO4C4]|nr:HAMP domain-containing histidine kinase [Kamptonema sp. SIO4C4]